MAAELAGALREARAALAAAGVDSPDRDAAALAAHVLGVPESRLPLVDGALPVDARAALDALVRRRAGREPLQHLTGQAGFRRLTLAVGPGVFVPRPETESLVEWCLGHLAGRAAPRCVDLCAGSGAVALALADEHPGAQVEAVERDPAAFAWLARNCAGQDRVHPRLADAADVPAALAGRCDLVVANPPYLADGSPVAPEVHHDPAGALWSGPDGLDGLRLVAGAAARLLAPGGALAVEHADDAAERSLDYLRSRGWRDVAGHADLAGRPRFVTARWAP